MKKSISMATTLLFLASLSMPFSTKAQRPQFTIFLYAAKFVCGKADNDILAPGQYFTAINVHNASPSKTVKFIKRFAIALPDERPGAISGFTVNGTIGGDQAIGIDCANIYKHTNTPSGQFLEGYALLYSLGELDVVSILTAGHNDVETLHTERVPVRKIRSGSSPQITRRFFLQ